MSSTTLPQAALQYNFENITGNSVPNLTDSTYNGTKGSGCIPGHDPVYGSYLEFTEGDHVSINALSGTGNYDFSNGLTVTAWVNLEEAKDMIFDIIKFSGLGGDSLSLQYISSRFLVCGNNTNIPSSSQPINEWIYVAITCDASNSGVLYLKSTSQFQEVQTGKTDITLSGLSVSTVTLGLEHAQKATFKGKMAWLSVYNQVLTKGQLLSDMAIKGGVQLPNASLQYDFKNISGTTLPNLTDPTYNGTIGSGVTSFNDPEFGNCLVFDGTDSVTIPNLPSKGAYDFSQGISIGAWVYVDDIKHAPTVICLGSQSSGHLQLFSASGNAWLLMQGSDNFYLNTPTDQVVNQWVYVAATLDSNGNGNVYVYSNFGWLSNKTTDVKISLTDGLGTTDNLIGNAGSDTSSGFHGRIAYVSVYNCALAKEFLEQDMLLGRLQSNKAFRKTLPLEFSLTSNDNGHNPPVLFIEKQGQGKKMNLAITNTGSGPIGIPKVTTAVSAKNYQLQLRFKPGILSSNFLGQTKAWSEGQWSLGIYEDDKTGEACLNIVNTGDAITLQIQSVTNINLGKVNANPLGGARNTSVMFHYEGLQVSGNDLSGHRKQSLSIISHLGQKDIPLQVGVLGAPRILNNGTATELIIRVQNIDPTANIDLQSVIEQKKAAFEVGFLIQAENQVEEWALIDHKEGPVHLDWPVIGVIELAADKGSTSIKLDEPLTRNLTNTTLIIDPVDGTKFNVTIDGTAHVGHQTLTLQSPGLQNSVQQGAVVTLASNQTDWTQTNNGATSGYYSWTIQYHGNGVLAPGDSVDFLLKEIQCKLPAGQAFITLKYFNLGGYWDGEFTIAVEKSLISMNESTMGIGMIQDDLAPNTVLQLPYTAGSANVGLLVGGDSSHDNGGITSAITVVSTDSGDSSNALTILDNSGDKTMFVDFEGGTTLRQLTINGAETSSLANISASFLSVDYPPSGSRGIAIGDWMQDVLAGALSIGIKDDSQGPAIQVANNTNKDVFFTVNSDGTTAIDTLKITGSGTSDLGTIEVDQLTINGTGTSTLGAASASSLQIDYPAKGDYGFCVGTWQQANLAGAFCINAPTNTEQAAALVITSDLSSNFLFDVFSNGRVNMNTQLDGSSYTHVFSISVNNYIGIRTAGPVAPLDVEHNETGTNQCINATGNIHATQFITQSDARTKQLQNTADGEADLKLINQLKVRDYQMVDSKVHGDTVYKGLMAQEAAEVIPQVVKKSKGFLPNIYTDSVKTTTDKTQKTLEIQMAEPHGLQAGDWVRLGLESGYERFEVIATETDLSFVIKDWEFEDTQVFVYGKKVDDFHGIDYNEVAMHGISAIQQLSKEVEMLKAENASLKQQLTEGLAELRKEIEGLKQ